MDCDNADDDNNDDDGFGDYDDDGTILIQYPSNKMLIFYNKTQTCHARLRQKKLTHFIKIFHLKYGTSRRSKYCSFCLSHTLVTGL